MNLSGFGHLCKEYLDTNWEMDDRLKNYDCC